MAVVATYEVVFEFHPPGIFGLPDGDRIVIPPSQTPEPQFGPLLNTLTWNFVTHGTLPKYRDIELHCTISIDQRGIDIRDNFMTVSLETADERSVVQVAIDIAKRFCVALSATTQHYVQAVLLQAVDTTHHRVLPKPQDVILADVVTYNLDALTTSIRQAASIAGLRDPVLTKALAYFHHARFLWIEVHNKIFARSLPDSQLIAAQVILNCHKSISTIIGDNSADGDYQSRYRTFRMISASGNRRKSYERFGTTMISRIIRVIGIT